MSTCNDMIYDKELKYKEICEIMKMLNIGYIL